jgi:hypothetical protein
MSAEQADTAAKLVEAICPLLAGHEPEVQSAALADLTAMWLAGMQDLDNPESADLLALRERLFHEWCETVRKLVTVNAAILRERYHLNKP